MPSGNFSFKNQSEGLLRDSDLNYKITNDGGLTWQPIISNGAIRSNKIDCVKGTSNTYFQIGQTIDSDGDLLAGFGSSYSTDGGNNWINLDNVGTSPVIPYSVKFQSIWIFEVNFNKHKR